MSSDADQQDAAGDADSPTTDEPEASAASDPPEAEPKIRVIRSREVENTAIERLFDPPPKLVKRQVLRAIEDAHKELDEAAVQGRDIVDEAREEAERIREQAREEGLRQGFEEVMEHLGKAKAEYARLQDEAESDMLDMAFRVAKRIVGHAVDLEPQIIRDIVSESLEHVRGRRQIVVFVHPDDLPIVQAAKNELVQLVEGASVYFDENPEVDRGGCFIETESGRIDARLETQLDVLRQALLRGG